MNWKNYLVEWIKDISFEFSICPKYIHITILYLCIHVGKKIRIALSTPKYGFIISNESIYYYDYEGWYFYKKKIIGNFSFYIMHLVGDEITRIENA